MRKIIMALTAVAVFTATAAAQSTSNSEPRRLIYGIDDRIDLFQDTSDKYRHFADSVVSLWNAGRLSPTIFIKGKTAKLRTGKYNSISSPNDLHKDERFRNQPTGPFCSGSLVGPDLIMTASHCIHSESRPGVTPVCADIKFVFGFAVKKKGRYPKSIPASEVYSCASVVARGEWWIIGDDFALIKLDRAVSGHTPLAINRGDSITRDAEVFTIGHPKGLPLKIATYGKVRDVYENGSGLSMLSGSFFTTDMDIYTGNSGGPVFNAKTGLVEGIVVRGSKDDFVKKDGYNRSNVVAQDEGAPNISINISVLAGLIPAERAKTTAVTIDMSAIMPDQARLDQIRDLLDSQ